MTKVNKVVGVILGGGLSTRVGRDKGKLELGGMTLLERTLENMGSVFQSLVFVTNNPEPQVKCKDVLETRDEVPNLGPLGGILAGLRAASTERIFVVAYDMPFFLATLVKYLIELDPSADVVVPRIAGRIEPLHAVYSQKCLPFIQRHLDEGKSKVIEFYEDVDVRFVDESEILRFDPDLRSFFNINTLDDLNKAADMLGGQNERK